MSASHHAADSEALGQIAVLMTCHNRRDQTLLCLRRLAGQRLSPGCRLSVFLVDDGSDDGTSEAVRLEFPDARIIVGNGALYWCGGMRLAWSIAAEEDPEFYLLANDDTLLEPDAISMLLCMVRSAEARVIAVAAIHDGREGRPTYGGIRMGEGLVHPTGSPERCDTFNGNAVLVPRAVFKELGMLHSTYTHGMGDFDYGYQASKNGVEVLQSPGFLGSCDRNPMTGSWRDRSLGRLRRLQILCSPKGLPFREWLVFNRRNSGSKWLLRTLSPYVKVILGR
ncbi:glycosyltransferase family 2 protein [Haloferula rosea]|uniref:Glycosyltransferase family 2 protein n=1 Tax=Haloferula rosea TaxID=490093 RepID=A0A934VBW8_9BACT|nr:glycosyltransferase family 2 protein [Haloferula rosea]MBK1827823.1 glycosyltransferase family 2 protein [Haloferula rosea]